MTTVNYPHEAEKLREVFPNLTIGSNQGSLYGFIGRYHFSVYLVGPGYWVATFGLDLPLPMDKRQVFGPNPRQVVKDLLSLTRDFLASELDQITLGILGCKPNEQEQAS